MKKFLLYRLLPFSLVLCLMFGLLTFSAFAGESVTVDLVPYVNSSSFFGSEINDNANLTMVRYGDLRVEGNNSLSLDVSSLSFGIGTSSSSIVSFSVPKEASSITASFVVRFENNDNTLPSVSSLFSALRDSSDGWKLMSSEGVYYSGIVREAYSSTLDYSPYRDVILKFIVDYPLSLSSSLDVRSIGFEGVFSSPVSMSFNYAYSFALENDDMTPLFYSIGGDSPLPPDYSDELGDINSSLGDINSSLDDVNSSLGDINSSLDIIEGLIRGDNLKVNYDDMVVILNKLKGEGEKLKFSVFVSAIKPNDVDSFDFALLRFNSDVDDWFSLFSSNNQGFLFEISPAFYDDIIVGVGDDIIDELQSTGAYILYSLNQNTGEIIGAIQGSSSDIIKEIQSTGSHLIYSLSQVTSSNQAIADKIEQYFGWLDDDFEGVGSTLNPDVAIDDLNEIRDYISGLHDEFESEFDRVVQENRPVDLGFAFLAVGMTIKQVASDVPMVSTLLYYSAIFGFTAFFLGLAGAIVGSYKNSQSSYRSSNSKYASSREYHVRQGDNNNLND